MKRAELILCEGFGGEEIEGTGALARSIVFGLAAAPMRSSTSPSSTTTTTNINILFLLQLLLLLIISLEFLKPPFLFLCSIILIIMA